jgi:hypothetical protein
MHKRLNLVLGTLVTSVLFVAFHALLAVTAICCLVFMIPAMLFRWTTDNRKVHLRGHHGI